VLIFLEVVSLFKTVMYRVTEILRNPFQILLLPFIINKFNSYNKCRNFLWRVNRSSHPKSIHNSINYRFSCDLVWICRHECIIV